MSNSPLNRTQAQLALKHPILRLTTVTEDLHPLCVSEQLQLLLKIPALLISLYNLLTPYRTHYYKKYFPFTKTD